MIYELNLYILYSLILVSFYMNIYLMEFDDLDVFFKHEHDR